MKLKDFNEPFRTFCFLMQFHGASAEFEIGYRPRIQAMITQLASDAGNVSIEDIDCWATTNEESWDVTPAVRTRMLDVCEYIVTPHVQREKDPWTPTMEKLRHVAATLRQEIAGTVVIYDPGYKVHDESYTTIETLYWRSCDSKTESDAKVSAVERSGIVHAAVTVDLSMQHNILIRLTNEAPEPSAPDLSNVSGLKLRRVDIPEADLSAPADPSVALERQGGGTVRLDAERKTLYVVPDSNTLGDLPTDMAKAIEIKLQATFDEFLKSLPKE